jgi:hypothetical protein
MQGCRKHDPVVHIARNKQKQKNYKERISRPNGRWILDHPNASGALDGSRKPKP